MLQGTCLPFCHSRRDPLATLRKAGRAYVQFGLGHPEEYRLLFMQPHAREPLHAADDDGLVPDETVVRAAFERLGGYVAALPRRRRARGRSFKLATALWAGLHGVVALQITLPNFPFGRPGELAGDVIDLLLGGLKQSK